MTAPPPTSLRAEPRSARFISWVRAWRGGFVALDEAAAAIRDGEDHALVPLATAPSHTPAMPTLPTAEPPTLRDGLRRFVDIPTEEISLVLPAPGDPLGLPGPGVFSRTALGLGEAVIVGTQGFVPEVNSHRSGSGEIWYSVVWRELPLREPGPFGEDRPIPPGIFQSLGEAETDLVTAISDAADTLERLDIGNWRPESAEQNDEVRPLHDHPLPPGFSVRARRVHARALVVRQLLLAAAQDGPTGALSAHEANERAIALRPLDAASRRALVTACNSRLEDD